MSHDAFSIFIYLLKCLGRKRAQIIYQPIIFKEIIIFRFIQRSNITIFYSNFIGNYFSFNTSKLIKSLNIFISNLFKFECMSVHILHRSYKIVQPYFINNISKWFIIPKNKSY